MKILRNGLNKGSQPAGLLGKKSLQSLDQQLIIVVRNNINN